MMGNETKKDDPSAAVAAPVDGDVSCNGMTKDEAIQAMDRGEMVAHSTFTPDEMAFLRCWYEGDFEVIRREWPEAPETVFIGADPLHPKTKL